MNEFKVCPFCAEQIKVNAVKCKHCMSMLANPVLQQPRNEPGTGMAADLPRPPARPAPPPPLPPSYDAPAPPPPLPVPAPSSSPPPVPATRAAKAGKAGFLLPVLAIVTVLILIIVGINIFKEGSQPETPPPPVAPERQAAPDYNTLEGAIYDWITAEAGNDDFILLNKSEVPGIDEFFQKYGADDPIIVYRIESTTANDATVLLGIPHGEAFYRLRFEWQERAWVVSHAEDLWQ